MLKRILKITAAVVSVLVVIVIVALVVGPFLAPVKPLEGLATPSQIAGDKSIFLTIPYPGTDGIEIHYLAENANAGEETPTFVLLHGSLFNAYTWSEVMDFFGERGRVIAYDQIPYGLSEKLVEGDWIDGNPYTSGAAVDQLFLFLDALDVENAALVGNSYGAVLALDAALAEPERVDALILADAAVYVEESLPTWLLNLPQVRRLGPLFARQIGNSEAFVRQTYLDPAQISKERLAQTMIHTQVEDWDEALWEYLRVWGVDAPDVAAHIAEIQQPTLVLTGAGDAVVPVADSERLHAELPNSELVVLPACGHVPQEECPDAFEDAVDAWLDKWAEQIGQS